MMVKMSFVSMTFVILGYESKGLFTLKLKYSRIICHSNFSQNTDKNDAKNHTAYLYIPRGSKQ